MSEERKHNKQFTLTDIEQYLRGTLSPAEMHDLEKAALQDRFLADAIEGYQVSNLLKARENLSEIQNRLLAGQQEAVKEIPISIQQKRWWKIAAIIVLFAGAGSLGWYLFNPGTGKKEIAQKIVQPAKKDTVQQSFALVNQPATSQQQKPVLFNRDRQKEPAKKVATAEPVVDNEINKARIAETLVPENSLASITLVKKDAQSRDASKTIVSSQTNQGNVPPAATTIGGSFSGTLSASTLNSITSVGNLTALTVGGKITAGTLIGSLPLKNQYSITTLGGLTSLTVTGNIYAGNNSKPLNVFSGKVIDANTLKPIPNAVISFEKNNSRITTDTAGNFTFTGADTLQKIQVNSIGFEQKDLMAAASKTNHILLKEWNGQLDEVVVTGYATQRKKDLTGSVTSVSTRSIIPEGGWELFRSYLLKKISTGSKNDSTTVLHGAIVAELTIKNGKVYEAVIIKTFNDAFNKTLIQALKHGPKWVSPSTDRKEKYTVDFVL